MKGNWDMSTTKPSSSPPLASPAPPATPPTPRSGGPLAGVRHTLAIARRNLLLIRNDPGQLIDATIVPIVLTLVFVFVFGGAILGDQGDYTQYLVPGIMVQTISLATAVTGMSLNLDFSRGIMDRFRSLPIARASVLSGRILADACRLLLGQAIIVVFALIIGFRITTNLFSALAAVGLLLLFGIALSWIAATIGMALRSPQAVQGVGFLWMLPLQFGSSIFVPTDTMPGWLSAFAEANPTTLVTDTARHLLTGTPTNSIWGALAWIGGIMLVFVPLAIRQYRRRG
jgi:oleandomycin transport system permease protein